MFDIRLDHQPEHFLKKCEALLYDRIVSKLKELRENPVPHDAKKVVGMICQPSGYGLANTEHSTG